MTVFFTADQHFDHSNIIKHCDRPFPFVTQMNQTIMDNFNSMVTTKDTTYHLGDFIWKHNHSIALNFFKKLNGKHKVMCGNHDKWIRKFYNEEPTKPYEPKLNDRVQLIEPLKEIKLEGQRIVLCHYAMAVWPARHRGSWHLHGHSHGNYKAEYGKLLDVGVDVHNFFPVSFKQIAEYMGTRQNYDVDHHKEKEHEINEI